MKVILFLILTSLLASCNSQKKETDKTSSRETDTKVPSLINCYKYATATDTIILKLIHVGKSITGILVYSLKEKDKNKGTILGNMRGDILVADYTFLSEGIQSKRQVAFKKEGKFFVEGYGDIVNLNEKVYFKNLDSLSFNISMKLAEVACQ